jgi:transcriptional regulator with XRE-family HTH domain
LDKGLSFIPVFQGYNIIPLHVKGYFCILNQLGGFMAKRTYVMVVKLLNEHIPAEVSRNEFCRVTGINRNSVDRYMARIGEPSSATLEKMAEYFGVTVESLRGETGKLFPRVTELLYKEVTEAGKNVIATDTGLPVHEIELYITKKIQPKSKNIIELLSNYLGEPTELFKINGWDKFLETMPNTLAKQLFKKGRDKVSKKTGINSSVIYLACSEVIDLSEKTIKTLSKCYNVTVEYLYGEQILDDKSIQASEELWSAIDFLKKNIENEHLLKHVHQIESSAETILKALSSTSKKHQAMRGRTKQIIGAIPHNVLPIVTDKINKK